MIKYLVLLALLLAGSPVPAQPNPNGSLETLSGYYVSEIKGGTVLDGSGNKMVAGKKLSANDKLIFSTPTTKVVLLHPGKGRLLLTATKATPTSGNTFTAFVRDLLDLNKTTERGSAGAGPGCLTKKTDSTTESTTMFINRNISMVFLSKTAGSVSTSFIRIRNKNISVDSAHSAVTFVFTNGARYRINNAENDPKGYFILPLSTRFINDLQTYDIKSILFHDNSEQVYNSVWGFSISKRFSCFMQKDDK